jgi:hypothetical protein
VVDDAVHERSLRPYDREIGSALLGDVRVPGYVFWRGNAFSDGCNPRIAGRRYDSANQWGLGEPPRERMFAAAAADDEDLHDLNSIAKIDERTASILVPLHEKEI